MSAYAIMPEGQFVSIGSFPCKAVDNHPCLSPPSAAHYQRKRLVSNEKAESQQDRQNPSSFAGIRGVADAGGGRLARSQGRRLRLFLFQQLGPRLQDRRLR